MSDDRILRCPEAQSDVLVPSPAALADLGRFCEAGALLVVEEDVRLLLVGALALDCQFGGHDCSDGQSSVLVEESCAVGDEVVIRCGACQNFGCECQGRNFARHGKSAEFVWIC